MMELIAYIPISVQKLLIIYENEMSFTYLPFCDAISFYVKVILNNEL